MGKATRSDREKGFTLVELMIAMMVLAIVMAALAPAFYGALKATAATDYRSTANGLAVAAIEDMRAFPYYQMGYNQTDFSTSGSTALSCVSPTNGYQTGGSAPGWNSSAGLSPVELSTGSALDNVNNNLVISQTLSHVTYTITRCVYWMDSSTSKTAAYKLTWVGVSWSVASVGWHVSQTSAIYPGGEGKYASPGKNNDDPGAPTCVNQGTIPNAPQSLTATPDSISPASTMDLAWSAGSQPTAVLPLQYEISYNSSGPGGPWTPFSEIGLPDQNVDGLAASTTYWFQVVAVACDGTLSSAVVVSQATNSASQGCQWSNFTVTPKTASIDSNDKLTDGAAFQFSANVTSSCNNIAAYYSPRNDGTYVTDYAASAGSGTTTWTASASKWAAGTISFALYIGGANTGDTYQVTISCNAQHC